MGHLWEVDRQVPESSGGEQWTRHSFTQRWTWSPEGRVGGPVENAGLGARREGWPQSVARSERRPRQLWGAGPVPDPVAPRATGPRYSPVASLKAANFSDPNFPSVGLNDEPCRAL